jgi:hypothetical protein
MESNPPGISMHATRPSHVERARRLGEVLLQKTEVRKVAIALPSDGGDLDLARGVASAAKILGREVIPLVYEPGRRDYAPEVRDFRDSGAQALVLTGSAEESAEWLLAIRSARLAPLVLATSEINPRGLHDRVRAAAENAIYVGDEWQPLGTLRVEVAAAADSAGFAGRSDFAQGYLIGRNLVRLILEGNFTSARMTKALARQSPRLPRIAVSFVANSPLDSERRPLEVQVPLHQIRNGVAVPYEF